MRVVKENKPVEDSWQRLQEADIGSALPEGDVIIPFSYWQQHETELAERKGRLGVCVYGDDATEEVAKALSNFDLIALDFPAFKDGRGYSHARLLREKYGYQGDIRAVGDVLRDQLFFMQRCGFSSFQLREDKDIEDALQGFSDFSVSYQGAADGVLPVYKQR